MTQASPTRQRTSSKYLPGTHPGFLFLWAAMVAVDGWLSLAHVERLQRLLPDFLSWDKAEHALMYMGLTLVAGLGAQSTKSWILLALAGEFLGILLEFLQSLTGYRTLDIHDVAANSVGVALGLFGGWIWRRTQARVQLRSS